MKLLQDRFFWFLFTFKLSCMLGIKAGLMESFCNVQIYTAELLGIFFAVPFLQRWYICEWILVSYMRSFKNSLAVDRTSLLYLPLMFVQTPKASFFASVGLCDILLSTIVSLPVLVQHCYHSSCYAGKALCFAL